MEWTENLKRAIAYMEAHLLEEIDIEQVAAAVYVSPFYFQRGFSLMTGYTVGEYIRGRRLYLAALDALTGRDKVIDLAYRYGYQTPESFTRAFCRFHGVSPLQIRGDATKITVFLPLTINVTIQGGNAMDYTVQKEDAIQLIGMSRKFDAENSYQTIPLFWADFCKRCKNGEDEPVYQKAVEDNQIGEFGICIDGEPGEKQFRYMIAGRYQGGPVPEGMELYTLPALTWAKFRCVGPMPGALQSVNTKIFKEWLPGNPDYEVSAWLNVEWYEMGDTTAPDYESAIWIPVKHK